MGMDLVVAAEKPTLGENSSNSVIVGSKVRVCEMQRRQSLTFAPTTRKKVDFLHCNSTKALLFPMSATFIVINVFSV